MVRAAATAALIPITLAAGLIGIKAAGRAWRTVAGDEETAMPAPTTTDHGPAASETTTFDVWDVFRVAHESLALWSAACSAWCAYLTLLGRATGPAAVFDAQTQLFAEGFDVCSQAAADRLREAGVTEPLLNDA